MGPRLCSVFVVGVLLATLPLLHCVQLDRSRVASPEFVAPHLRPLEGQPSVLPNNDVPSLLETSESARAELAAQAQVQAHAGVGIAARLGLQTEEGSTVVMSTDAAAQAMLEQPGLKAALNAKTPDAVDKLIQGILEGSGKGGVVTSEFNKDGVHAVIISNVNELRVTTVVDQNEERQKSADESTRKAQIKTMKDQTDEEDKKRQEAQRKQTK